MVARNFLIQDHLPYSRLLQVPDEEREFLTLDELKPHQLTELGGLNRNTEVSVSKSQLTVPVFSTASNSNQSSNNQQIYYDLNTQQTTNANNSSSLTNPYHYLNDPPPDKGSASYDQNSLCLDINTAGSSSNSFQSLMQSGYQDHQSSEMIQHLQNPPMNQLQSSVPLIHQDQNCFQEKKSIKRKLSFTENSDVDDDDPGDDAKSVRTTDDNKKQNHSEIEKRRRDKMNFYITELSSIVPVCHSMSRKLDKLTVLRMAVQHLKTIRGAVHSYTEGHYKPAFLSDQELKMLILQAAEGFLFVVSCDRGRILYVSESVSQVLNYSQGDLLGQSWFDIIHQKDVAKVKEQLSSLDLNTRDRLIDAKTMLPVKTDIPHGLSRLCPGARRSFLCRMKCKNFTHIKEEVEPNGTSNQTSGSQSGKENHKRKSKMNADKRYCVIQCTGYLKSWAPAKIGLDEQETDGEGDAVNLSCLVAVGRIPPNVFTPTNLPNSSQNSNLRIIQFFSRHATDGRFLFVDQRATLVLGFLPQELLTTSMYEYYHPDDIPKLIEAHKTALQGTEKVTTEVYRLRIKDGNFIKVQSEWKSFRNPWTKEIDYVIAKNSVILNETKVTVPEEGLNMDLNSRPIIANSRQSTGRDTPSQAHFEFFNQGNGGRPLRIVNTHIEASAIGRQVAEQALEYHRRYGENSSDSSPDPEREQGSNNSSNYHPSNHIMASMASESMTTNSVSNSHHSTAGNPTEMSSISDQAPLHPHPRRINGTLPGYNLIRSDHSSQSNSNSSIEGGSNSEQSAGNQDSIHIQNASMGQDGQNQANDGNDEAAMAVIMSLLEADAGLGGPVDFTGLPWPLP